MVAAAVPVHAVCRAGVASAVHHLAMDPDPVFLASIAGVCGAASELVKRLSRLVLTAPPDASLVRKLGIAEFSAVEG